MTSTRGTCLCGDLSFEATLPTKWVAHCHCTLFFRSRRWPGELHIVRSNFDGPVDREPQVHVFYESHAAWLRTDGDGLPRKAGSGEG